MLAKAAGLNADQVFLDLEDAVAPSLKNDETRAAIVHALRDQAWIASTRVVRVNAVGTPWCLDDILAIVGGAGESLDCVIDVYKRQPGSSRAPRRSTSCAIAASGWSPAPGSTRRCGTPSESASVSLCGACGAGFATASR